ncbi:MAG: hypothetical protein L6R39_003824 [Caloplaca ligustica]|nr:MAG: hypothetical protein L6R39_003824 [Caloplaca ligustica]
MLVSTALALLLAAIPAQARTGVLQHDGHSRHVELSMCDTQQPDEALRSIHSELSAQKKLRKVKPRGPESFEIDTHFHFVVTEDTAHLYSVERTTELANAQLAALNTAYAPMSITFTPIFPPTYTVNTTWATNNDDLAMKHALRTGSYSSLNIYFQSNLSAPGSSSVDSSSMLLGYCQLPTTATTTSCPYSPPHSNATAGNSGCKSTSSVPTNYVNDGCNVLLASMPGGGMQEYDQGKTAVHEVGHWFGLLHTFEDNSCSGGDRGDFIDDTPQEMTATDGCPVGKDSCPGSPGVDPIGNYMDYSSDACYTNFSPLQQERIVDLYKLMRQGN